MNIPVLLVLIILSSSAFAARTEPEIREAIRNFTKQRHPGPTDDFWKSMGDEALPVIRKMYAESVSPVEKTFLMDGLSRFTDTATGNFLKNEIESSTDEIARKKLLSAVIRSQGEDAFDFVEPYLKDADPHVRMKVAQELGAFAQNEKIRSRLEEFRKTEKKPWVVAGMERKGANPEIQKTRRPEQWKAESSAQTKSSDPAVVLKPLLESDWAGIWKGSLLGALGAVPVEAVLSVVDRAAKPLVWKVTLNLPKKVKQEWRSGDFTVHYFMTSQSHWIELRHPKLDAVFIAQKKESK
jgi:hypothetical protein